MNKYFDCETGISTREEVKRLYKENTVKEMMSILGKSESQIRAILGSEGLKAKRVVNRKSFNEKEVRKKIKTMKCKKHTNLANEILRELGIIQSNENIVACRRIMKENKLITETRGGKKYIEPKENDKTKCLTDDIIARCREVMNKKSDNYIDYEDFSTIQKLEMTEIDLYERRRFSKLKKDAKRKWGKSLKGKVTKRDVIMEVQKIKSGYTNRGELVVSVLKNISVAVNNENIKECRKILNENFSFIKKRIELKGAEL